MKTKPAIEPLEPRIAPASVFTYTDVDGDKVKIASSANGPNIADDVFLFPAGVGNQCAGLDLSPAYAGANIIFTVTKVPGGDGFANVGYIDAVGIDLGNVTIKGDLASVDCGDGNADRPALKMLTVHSMGRFGLATQGGGGDLVSNIAGHLGALKITGDFKDALLSAGSIGSVTIGGSIIGGGDFQGEISASGDIGPVKIGGDIVGGNGGNAGLLQSAKKIASVTVGGSIIGGSREFTGGIRAFELGPIKIGHDLRGGTSINAGTITTLDNGKIASVMIGGDVLGASGARSGCIRAGDFGTLGNGTIGNVTIKGSLVGGDGDSSGFLSGKSLGLVKIAGDVRGGSQTFSGAIVGEKSPGIQIGGSVLGGDGVQSGYVVLSSSGPASGAIKVAHSVIAGAGPQSGTVAMFTTVKSLQIGGDVVGSILSVNDAPGGITIGGSVVSATLYIISTSSLTIKGSLIGTPAALAQISLLGGSLPGLALGTLNIGGRVEWAIITDQGSTQPGVRIGAVRVGGDWIASSLAAGIDPVNGRFGDADDKLRNAEYSGIGAISIRGTVIGSTAANDHFGFVAERIGSFKAGGVAFKLNATSPPKDVFEFSLFTGDVTLREV